MGRLTLTIASLVLVVGGCSLPQRVPFCHVAPPAFEMAPHAFEMGEPLALAETLPSDVVYETRTIERSYLVQNPETGEWEVKVRQETVVVPRRVDAVPFRGQVLQAPGSIEVAEMSLDVIGVNPEKVREALLATIRQKLRLSIANEGQSAGNVALIEVGPVSHQGGLLHHRITATIDNIAGDQVSILVETHGFVEGPDGLRAIERFADQELAAEFLSTLRKALTDS